MTLSTVPYALAVDDDPLILMDARSILEDAGYRCHEADDGDGAIDLLGQKAEQIMLLFSDVEMPGSLDGFELAARVSDQANTYPNVANICVDGIGIGIDCAGGDRSLALQRGAEDHPRPACRSVDERRARRRRLGLCRHQPNGPGQRRRCGQGRGAEDHSSGSRSLHLHVHHTAPAGK